MLRLILSLVFLLVLAAPVAAGEKESGYYHRAFAAIAGDNPGKAEDFATQGHDPILNKVVQGYAMALPGNDYSFGQLNAFIEDHPDWPSVKGIRMIAEQKIPATLSSAQIVAWFTAHPAITLVGFYTYVDALNRSGLGQAVQDVIRTRWIEGDFSGDEQASFYAHFGVLLDAAAMKARMDRLLWKNSDAEARRLMPYLSATDKLVAEARLALAAQDRNAEALLARVPSEARNDPGLIYQRVRWYVKSNQDEDADDILLHPPLELGNAEAWWEQRQIMVRRAIERHDFSLAYQLALAHGTLDSKHLVEAEFLCGWLSLRFLDRADVARQHFQALYDNASTPISRARGAYWLGRSYEALGDKNAAEQAYEDAAIFNTSYYGQLAATRIYEAPVLTAKADPPLPEAARRAFMSRDIIRATERLLDIGEDDRARAFFRAATDKATERAEFIILTEIATRMHRPDLAIQTIKAANQKNMLIATGGFPLLTLHTPTPPEIAFTHALIRQESMFAPAAESGVGARGLMQLMPATAKETAKKLGIRYRTSSLSDPAYSLQLGTAFVQQQIEHFNGSYILALAGYNAGPGRVNEWLRAFGDPRTGAIDPVDWVELIPIHETRNYVQRIVESLQVYRSKLAGGQAPLLILKDLRR